MWNLEFVQEGLGEDAARIVEHRSLGVARPDEAKREPMFLGQRCCVDHCVQTTAQSIEAPGDHERPVLFLRVQPAQVTTMFLAEPG